jgi:hypothetical protein
MSSTVESDAVREVFRYAEANGLLTEAGTLFWKDLKAVLEEQDGAVGMLTSKGAQELYEIGSRMGRNFRQVFKGDRSRNSVRCISSTSPRCLISMTKFADGLKEKVRGLNYHYITGTDHYAYLAYHMITRPDFPSYGNWIARGATTLWEEFYSVESGKMSSLNHHFWGDIAAVMIEYFAGIRVDYRYTGAGISIKPVFPELLDRASATHREVSVSWVRHDGGITLTAECPEALASGVSLPAGYVFSSGEVTLPLRSGSYEIVKVK